jgi:hypothetical protein
VAEVVTGSSQKWVQEAGATQLPVFGAVKATQEHVRQVIMELVDEGLLRRNAKDEYPVLHITDKGRAELERLSQAPLTTPAPQARNDEAAGPDHAHGNGAVDMPPTAPAAPAAAAPAPVPTAPATAPAPAAELDRLVGLLLRADAEEAKAVVERLRLYHPREVAARLTVQYDAADSVREQSRAAWAAGELCGEAGLALLLKAAGSATANVRRLAALALGKVAAGAGTTSLARREAIAQAQRVLQKLTQDTGPQVAEYARKALTQFPPGQAKP